MQFYVTQFSVQSIIKMEQDKDVVVKHKEFVDVKYNVDEEPNSQYFKQQELFQQQNENVQVTRVRIILNNHNWTMYKSNMIPYRHATRARLNGLT